MLLIGDCHGKIDALLKICAAHSFSELFQLGDMGLGFKDVSLPDVKGLKFIRGNHDSPGLCRMHSCYAGDYGFDADKSIFWLGGAFSIDWQWRVPGKSWWPDEELSASEAQKAFELYSETKPKIVLTHDAPQSVGEKLLLDGGFRPEKWGSTESATAKALQAMLDAHKPEKWYFGHYHRDWAFNLEHSNGITVFRCLNELSTAEI